LSGKKGTLWEGGIRVPALIEWPARIRAPRRIDVACGSVDIYPTVLDVAGVAMKNQPRLDGESLRPLLMGEKTARSKPLGFWVYPAAGRPVRSHEILAALRREQEGEPPAAASATKPDAVNARQTQYPEDEFPGHAAWIDGRFKLHRIPEKSGDVRFALYDLANDAAEKTDLVTTETDRIESMKRALAAWQRSVVQSLNGHDDGSAGGRTP